MDTNNYIYGQKNEMLHEETYKIDIDNLSDEEKQTLTRKYIERIDLDKTGLRGHYLITIKFKNGLVFKYKYWSSGPWNNLEKIEE